jgi:hypothetical protein
MRVDDGLRRRSVADQAHTIRIPVHNHLGLKLGLDRGDRPSAYLLSWNAFIASAIAAFSSDAPTVPRCVVFFPR